MGLFVVAAGFRVVANPGGNWAPCVWRVCVTFPAPMPTIPFVVGSEDCAPCIPTPFIGSLFIWVPTTGTVEGPEATSTGFPNEAKVADLTAPGRLLVAADFTGGGKEGGGGGGCRVPAGAAPGAAMPIVEVATEAVGSSAKVAEVGSDVPTTPTFMPIVAPKLGREFTLESVEFVATPTAPIVCVTGAGSTGSVASGRLDIDLGN